MGYCGRILLLITGAASLLSVLDIVAQSAPRKNPPVAIQTRSQASGDHGLVLILSRDATPEPPDSSALKTCLAHNPRPACVPLNLTIMNEGNETIMGWFQSCSNSNGDSDYSNVGFDLLTPDGRWRSLPRSFDPPSQIDIPLSGNPMCGGFVVHGLWPLDNYNQRLRLADLFPWMDTNAPFPAEALARQNQEKIYAIFAAAAPLTIRAHQFIYGCIASDNVKQGSDLKPFSNNIDVRQSAGSLCAGGFESMLRNLNLQSNELTLESKSLQ
jgi:hypothetical protein